MRLDIKDKKDFLKQLEIRYYTKDQIIAKEHDLCTMVGFIFSGEVIISSYSVLGKELRYITLSKGELFGNNLVFSSNNEFIGDVISKCETKIGYISKENFLNLLMSDSGLLTQYLYEIAENTKKMTNQIKLLSFDNASEKIIFYLSTCKNKQYKYKSISDFANKLGITREALSRNISLLIKENIIIREHKTILLK